MDFTYSSLIFVYFELLNTTPRRRIIRVCYSEIKTRHVELYAYILLCKSFIILINFFFLLFFFSTDEKCNFSSQRLRMAIWRNVRIKKKTIYECFIGRNKTLFAARNEQYNRFDCFFLWPRSPWCAGMFLLNDPNILHQSIVTHNIMCKYLRSKLEYALLFRVYYNAYFLYYRRYCVWYSLFKKKILNKYRRLFICHQFDSSDMF